MRNESNFSDVTLVCEENVEIEAHKIILSASSPFFNTVLKKNKHSHPMIYMRGLKAKDIVAIVDFMYQGEANIFQDDLDAFLAFADELQIKGLAGSKDRLLDDEEESTVITSKSTDEKKLVQKPPSNKIKRLTLGNIEQNNRIVETNAMVSVEQAENAESLKIQINSMMEQVIDIYFNVVTAQ